MRTLNRSKIPDYIYKRITPSHFEEELKRLNKLIHKEEHALIAFKDSTPIDSTIKSLKIKATKKNISK